MTPSPEMIRRADAAQATLDRFKDRPFALGSFDCVRMVAFHLRQLGHTPPLSKGGSYTTLLGAKRALRRAGHASLAAALDALGFPPIAPAEALVGDVVQLPAEDELGALTIYVGNGRTLGYHQDVAGATVLQPLRFAGAWRVPV